ncbi:MULTISPECIES: hypothetical protein [Methylomicrobium]|uniref:Uncharacterized protein n=1 Tax=Methylomicrobium album BG8 TaxID=686340 RepID=H8GND6_METAL|nr:MULTISPECIES: hypothetical protein [Methylomicrobium]EIC28365.1 hypothetical protein Metal_0514 [Methylomicrobium album BG8]
MTASKPPVSEKSVGTVAIALVGPSFVWGLHFAAVYAIQSLFCDILGGGRAAHAAQTAVIAATVAALLILLLPIAKPDAVLRMKRPEKSLSFLAGVMRLLALLSFFGVLWAGSAALLVPACAPLS